MMGPRLSEELDFDGSWDEHQCMTERCEWCNEDDCECVDYDD